MVEAIVVTGTAPYSFGEKLVIEFASQQPNTLIIAMDRITNPAIRHLSNVREICTDLDALASQSIIAFGEGVYNLLVEVLHRESVQAIRLVCFSAGVYEYGDFANLPTNQRLRLYGLNILGKAEALHAILRINSELSFDNRDGLTVGDIGSLHGLRLTPSRSLYSACKAFGLDFVIALHRGREIRRGVHIVPGPIDTHMLHRNHWISKAGAPSNLFEAIRGSGGDAYWRIFAECNESEFVQWVHHVGQDEVLMCDYFKKYIDVRRKVRQGSDGILDPSIAATIVYQVLNFGTANENLYILTAPNSTAMVKTMAFEESSRSDLCEGGKEWVH